MLVYTGFRLASPREFLHVYKIGREQFAVYVTTIVAVLATDLLVGIGIGIVVELVIQVYHGAPIRSLFVSRYDAELRQDDTYYVSVRQSAVFGNWILFKRRVEQLGFVEGKHVVLDLSDTRLVDHTVMSKLHLLEREFARRNLRLEITGLEDHVSFSDHPHSARKKMRPLATASAGS